MALKDCLTAGMNAQDMQWNFLAGVYNALTNCGNQVTNNLIGSNLVLEVFWAMIGYGLFMTVVALVTEDGRAAMKRVVPMVVFATPLYLTVCVQPSFYASPANHPWNQLQALAGRITNELVMGATGNSYPNARTAVGGVVTDTINSYATSAGHIWNYGVRCQMEMLGTMPDLPIDPAVWPPTIDVNGVPFKCPAP